MTPHEVYNKCYKEKRRNQELESIIAIDSYYSYLYARDVIKSRFEEGEKSIANDPTCSYLYARDVIKSPFPLCHPVIFSSPFKDDYIDFLKSINYDLREIGEWLI
jgi:hypothetical protein